MDLCEQNCTLEWAQLNESVFNWFQIGGKQADVHDQFETPNPAYAYVYS